MQFDFHQTIEKRIQFGVIEQRSLAIEASAKQKKNRPKNESFRKKKSINIFLSSSSRIYGSYSNLINDNSQ